MSKDRNKLSAYIFALCAVRLEEVVIFFSFTYPFSPSCFYTRLAYSKRTERSDRKGVVVDLTVYMFEREKRRNRKEKRVGREEKQGRRRTTTATSCRRRKIKKGQKNKEKKTNGERTNDDDNDMMTRRNGRKYNRKKERKNEYINSPTILYLHTYLMIDVIR